MTTAERDLLLEWGLVPSVVVPNHWMVPGRIDTAASACVRYLSVAPVNGRVRVVVRKADGTDESLHISDSVEATLFYCKVEGWL